MPSPSKNTPDASLIDLIETPALLIAQDRIIYANIPAIDLLGAHIIGQDVRLAIRSPDAIEAIFKQGGGRARITGLSVPGSIWNLTVKELDDKHRLAMLSDLSIQMSVARAHSDFVANASHELRTPLAAILGFVETLEDPEAGNDPEVRTRFLATIKREAQRMGALIEDLMSLSRIEAGKHEAPDNRIDLVAIIREEIGQRQEASNIHLICDIEHINLLGDRSQIAQVARNLIDNAIKYGAPNEAVTIRLEATENGWALFSVEDKGEGIDPEHLPRLTERFYRADASRSRAVGGTGLGLSIVKHIVERHRGRFDMNSRKGHGSIATVMLPISKA